MSYPNPLTRRYRHLALLTCLILPVSSTWLPTSAADHTMSENATRNDTQTIRNLNTALEGETNAAYKYQLFAIRAEADGYPQIAKLFRAASKSESIHRDNHRRVIQEAGGTPAPVSLAPVKVATTRENLQVPIRGEAKERATIYPKFIQQANRDKVPAAVRSFTYARDAETEHERLFRNALAQLGHNPETDYYVSKISGDTVAVPAGQSLARADSQDYLRIG